MRNLPIPIVLLALVPLTTSASADTIAKTFNVDGVTRELLLYEGVPIPGGRPLILVFHGYGGTAQIAAKRFHLEEEWPTAMVAYIQGLTIPRDRGDGRIEPGKERAGWQRNAEQDGQRDLKMVDAVVQGLSEEYDVDTSRIYACGYSNGAVFTWVLVATRPHLFAAFAPVAGVDNGNIEEAATPTPVIFHFGEQDKAFKLAWAEKTIRRVKRMNRIAGQAEPWGTVYQWFKPEEGGAPFVLNLHPRGHEIPAYAPENIVAFFKMQSRSER